MIEIRKIKKEDITDLVELYFQLTNSYPDTNKMIDLLDNSNIFVYLIDNKIIATVELTKCIDLTNDCRSYYTLENFIVHKDYRNQGIGTELLDFCMEKAKKNNIRHINLTSSNYRIEAHNFYKNYGFEEVKGYKIPIK